MRELLTSTLELLAYFLAAAVLTVAGVLAELTSLTYVTSGNTVFGIWLAVMGGLALYAGLVALGLEEVLPRVRQRLGDT